MAYQVYGKGVNRKLVDFIHKFILNKIKPDLTFMLKVNISTAIKRLNKRGKKNRYDKFSRNFYKRVQNAFIKISRQESRRYSILDNSKDSKEAENIILNKCLKILQK